VKENKGKWINKIVIQINIKKTRYRKEKRNTYVQMRGLKKWLDSSNTSMITFGS